VIQTLLANFTLATDQQKETWSDTITPEYIRESGLLPYMQTKGGIINVQNELNGSAGAVIHVPLIGKLRGAGVRGSAALTGNEDTMPSYSMRITTDVLRNAVSIPYTQQYKTEMDLANAAKDDLRGWLAEQLRNDCIVALRSVPIPGVGTGTNLEDNYVTYEAATTGQQNAWQTANADRVLYGSLNSNMTAGNHATSLATITTTPAANKISAKLVSLARKKAKATTNSTTFAIRPYKTKTGQEWYVMFVDSNGFRDAKFDQTIYAANKDARPREADIMDNPIFSGTNTLFYDGVIIVEIPELPTVATGIGYAHFCGVQAVNLGYSMKAKPVRGKEDDYEFLVKVGVMETRGQSKASVLLTQVGMVSVFFSSVDDA
jgi:hypothetical protein